MKYRPLQCPKCSNNIKNLCSAAAFNNKQFKGESMQRCYAYFPSQYDTNTLWGHASQSFGSFGREYEIE